MSDLHGFRVLLVEDEFLLAHDLRCELENIGAIVIGPEPSVERALARISDGQQIDVAILDLNLCGKPAFPVADALAAKGVPFMFTTGYDRIPGNRYPSVIKCSKPIDMNKLLSELENMLLPKMTASTGNTLA